METAKIKELVSKMTLEEKASLCSGLDFWHTKGVERLGIPSEMVSDGPHGLRKQDDKADHLGINDSIQEYEGQWYVFYHRSSGNNEYHRCLCVEKINFNGDGKLTVLADGKAIAEAEPGTYEIKVTCKVDVVLHSVTIQ